MLNVEMVLPIKKTCRGFCILLFCLMPVEGFPQATEMPLQILDDISKGMLLCNADSSTKGYDAETIARKYFETKLAIAFFQTQENTEDLVIDWDIFVVGEECQVSDIKTEFVRKEDDAMVYQMKFTNVGHPKTVEYDFKFINNSWKVWDICYPATGWSLRKTLDLQ